MKEVQDTYGGNLTINTPSLYYIEPSTEKVETDEGKTVEKTVNKRKYIGLENSNIAINIHFDPRQKGVLWFPTFKASYQGKYTFKIPADKMNEKLYLHADLGSSDSIYNNIELKVNDKEQANILPLVKGESIDVSHLAGNTVTVDLHYDSNGMEQIMYYITPDHNDIDEIKNFNMKITTDFDKIDFPQSTISPTTKNKVGKGWELSWDFKNSVTGKDIGLIIPNKLNPGEIASKITFFAPISLLFYFIVIMMLAILMKVKIHPMNYFFIAAAFFSFHLMLSYFSDSMNIYLAFAIASVVSIILTSSYLRIFTPAKFALVYSPLAQLVYLIVFSFSFFFKGTSGIIVTIASVITLFVLMQLTGRLDWEEVFIKKKE
jgi:inner membrane protein involved in colicin E2 resistance